MLVSGVSSVLFAIMLWMKFPSSALWAIGLLFGLSLALNGWAFIALALCPLWVKSGHFSLRQGCPLYPQKRTCSRQWDRRITFVNQGILHRRRRPKIKIAESGTTRPIAMHQNTMYGRFS